MPVSVVSYQRPKEQQEKEKSDIEKFQELANLFKTGTDIYSNIALVPAKKKKAEADIARDEVALEATKATTQKTQNDLDTAKQLNEGVFDLKSGQDLLSKSDIVKPNTEGARSIKINEGGQVKEYWVKPKVQYDPLLPIKAENATLDNQTKKKNLESANANQSLAALYGKRMEQAENTFNALQQAGFDRSSVKQGVVDSQPFQGLKSAALQRHSQAETNFLTAALRRESGATIREEEFATGIKQYFPRAGDSPELLKQKQQNRQLVIEAMKQEAGNAWDKVKLPDTKPQATGKTPPPPGVPPVDADLSKLSTPELMLYKQHYGGK